MTPGNTDDQEPREPQEPHSLRSMRALVMGWLDGLPLPANAPSYGLRDWLNGTGLPPVNRDEAWYVWILRGLPLGAWRPTYERKLAERAAALVDETLDRTAPMSSAWVFNLLKLCAGLSCPNELQASLARLYDRGLAAVTADPPSDDAILRLLQSRHHGVPLTSALRESLRENQLDARYAGVWRQMVLGTPHGLLRGSVIDGFWGVLWMPESPARRGEPAVAAICEALLAVALTLEQSRERVAELTLFLDRIVQAYSSMTYWREPFLKLSQDVDWPVWAKQPLLYAILTELTQRELEELPLQTPEALAPCLERLVHNVSVREVLATKVDALAAPNPTHFVKEAWRLPATAWRQLTPSLSPSLKATFHGHPGVKRAYTLSVEYHGRPIPLPEDILQNERTFELATRTHLAALAESTAGRKQNWLKHLDSRRNPV